MSEGMKVFGTPQPRRHRFKAHWLRSGFLAFIGLLNLLFAIALFSSGVYLLATNKADGDAAKAELRVGGFSISAAEKQPKGTDAAAQQQGRQTLAFVCFALGFVPFSIAVLARTQYQVCRELALLQPVPEETEGQ